jgi:hypothetical protein
VTATIVTAVRSAPEPVRAAYSTRCISGRVACGMDSVGRHSVNENPGCVKISGIDDVRGPVSVHDRSESRRVSRSSRRPSPPTARSTVMDRTRRNDHGGRTPRPDTCRLRRRATGPGRARRNVVINRVNSCRGGSLAMDGQTGLRRYRDQRHHKSSKVCDRSGQ